MKKIKDLPPKTLLRIAYIFEIVCFLLLVSLVFGIYYISFSAFYVPEAELSIDSYKFGKYLSFIAGLVFLLIYRFYRNVKELNKIRKELKLKR